MIFNTLIFEISEDVATITINRPNAANALNAEMAKELHAVANTCANDDSVRAILITAAGKMFCAGGDLLEFHSAGSARGTHIESMAGDLHAALSTFAKISAPVVAAVNGTAAGAGFSLALSADYVIASDQAKFVSAYTAAGLTPDGSSTYYLAKHVGLLRAKELFLLNRQLSADEALAWGIVNQIAPTADLHGKALELAKKFAKGPTKAFGNVKRLLSSSAAATLENQLEFEARSMIAMMDTDDAPRGIESFLKKEKPVFNGK